MNLGQIVRYIDSFPQKEELTWLSVSGCKVDPSLKTLFGETIVEITKTLLLLEYHCKPNSHLMLNFQEVNFQILSK